MESLAKIPKDVDNYYVCMTRGHRFDLECLKRFIKNVCLCRHDGIKKAKCAGAKRSGRGRLYKRTGTKAAFPIGLAIGAQTSAEIALSVISEIVQCKNERAKAAETDEAILEELTDPQRLSKFAVNDENEMEYRMLCTIIEKGAVHPEASEPRCWSHRTTVLSEPSAEAVQKLK